MLSKYFVITGSIFLVLIIGVFILKSLLNKPAENISSENLNINQNLPENKSTENDNAKSDINNVMKLTSMNFENNQNIPSKYTCDGDNVNPQLTIENVPENTKSLVLIVDDPDAPLKTWVHWVLYNISPDDKSIGEASKPTGSDSGTTDFGNTDYGGPCPPMGTHRYFFKLYALDIDLPQEDGLTKGQVLEEMEGHIIEQAELIGLYSRSR